MDSQLIGVLIGIAVIMVAPWLEKMVKRQKQQHNGADRTPNMRAQRPVRPMPHKPEAAPAKVSAVEPSHVLPPEGLRVTVDKHEESVKAENPRPLHPLHGDDLRRAIVWGEILKPKF